MNNTNLFSLREYNDLYQKDLAKLLKVSQQTYSSWEKGIRIIPLKHICKLSNYYNVSMDYILGLSNNKVKSTDKTALNKIAIGKKIKLIREKHNLTMRDLAKDLNTTSSTIFDYENGKNMIITAFAYQICKKYNVSLDWLCEK